MPLFDYYCAECDDAFERLVLPSAPPDTCPVCGSNKLEQMISAPALHNTSSKNNVLQREYKGYRKSWSENAYMPKPKNKSKD